MLWLNEPMLFYPNQINGKWLCDITRSDTDKHAMSGHDVNSTRVLRDYSISQGEISTTAPCNSVLRAKQWVGVKLGEGLVPMESFWDEAGVMASWTEKDITLRQCMLSSVLLCLVFWDGRAFMLDRVNSCVNVRIQPSACDPVFSLSFLRPFSTWQPDEKLFYSWAWKLNTFFHIWSALPCFSWEVCAQKLRFLSFLSTLLSKQCRDLFWSEMLMLRCDIQWQGTLSISFLKMKSLKIWMFSRDPVSGLSTSWHIPTWLQRLWYFGSVGFGCDG